MSAHREGAMRKNLLLLVIVGVLAVALGAHSQAPLKVDWVQVQRVEACTSVRRVEYCPTVLMKLGLREDGVVVWK